eukprot:6769151-Lingulodinium_polyedra.AAC.1
MAARAAARRTLVVAAQASGNVDEGDAKQRRCRSTASVLGALGTKVLQGDHKKEKAWILEQLDAHP